MQASHLRIELHAAVKYEEAALFFFVLIANFATFLLKRVHVKTFEAVRAGGDVLPGVMCGGVIGSQFRWWIEPAEINPDAPAGAARSSNDFVRQRND